MRKNHTIHPGKQKRTCRGDCRNTASGTIIKRVKMNDKTERYPEIPSDRGDDIHNIEFAEDADLVLFMAGNQFMVMDDLILAFRDEYPEIKNIFYETLPPGLELRQILAGGASFRDRIIRGDPDIYTSVSEASMFRLRDAGLIGSYDVYLHNRLVLMLPRENRAGVKGINDLLKGDVRISQPGDMEDIAGYIVDMYRRAGGDAFVRRVMDEKREEGTTLLTVVHHRETPLRILDGTADAGPVWATEVLNAERAGLRITSLELGETIDQRDRVNYFVTRLLNCRNRTNAESFLSFIESQRAQLIYKEYGFLPHFSCPCGK